MTCEKHRLAAEAALANAKPAAELSAADLERIYQQGRAGGVREPRPDDPSPRIPGLEFQYGKKRAVNLPLHGAPPQALIDWAADRGLLYDMSGNCFRGKGPEAWDAAQYIAGSLTMYELERATMRGAPGQGHVLSAEIQSAEAGAAPSPRIQPVKRLALGHNKSDLDASLTKSSKDADGWQAMSEFYSRLAGLRLGRPVSVVTASASDMPGPEMVAYLDTAKNKLLICPANAVPLGQVDFPARHQAAVIQAAIEHEIGHASYTPPWLSKIANAIADGKTPAEGLTVRGRAMLPGLVHLIEDGRVNRQVLIHNAGLVPVFVAASQLRPQLPLEVDPNTRGSDDGLGALSALQIAAHPVRGRDPRDYLAGLSPQVRADVAALAPIIQAAARGTPEGVLNAAITVARRLQAYPVQIPDWYGQPPQPPPGDSGDQPPPPNRCPYCGAFVGADGICHNPECPGPQAGQSNTGQSGDSQDEQKKEQPESAGQDQAQQPPAGGDQKNKGKQDNDPRAGDKNKSKSGSRQGESGEDEAGEEGQDQQAGGAGEAGDDEAGEEGQDQQAGGQGESGDDEASEEGQDQQAGGAGDAGEDEAGEEGQDQQAGGAGEAGDDEAGEEGKDQQAGGAGEAGDDEASEESQDQQAGGAGDAGDDEASEEGQDQQAGGAGDAGDDEASEEGQDQQAGEQGEAGDDEAGQDAQASAQPGESGEDGGDDQAAGADDDAADGADASQGQESGGRPLPGKPGSEMAFGDAQDAPKTVQPGGEQENARLDEKIGNLTTQQVNAALAEMDAALAEKVKRKFQNAVKAEALGRDLHTPLPPTGNPAQAQYLESRIRRQDTRQLETVNVVIAAGKDTAQLKERRLYARRVAARMAAEVDDIRATVRQRRNRYLKHGQIDRGRLSAAVRGQQDIHQQKFTETDDTSMAVSIVVDMSSSMQHEISNGNLYAAVQSTGQALDQLQMPYECRAFGSGTNAIIKTMGDEGLDDDRTAFLAKGNLGGTTMSTSVDLAGTSLLGRPERNRVAVFLTDGAVNEHDEKPTRYKLNGLRQQGAVAFGVFFGVPGDDATAYMTSMFGRDWTSINSLDELPRRVGRRLADIFSAMLD